MRARVRPHVARFVLLLGAVVGINFFLPRLLPGSPFASAGATAVAVLPAERITEIRDAYGLGRPLTTQFLEYLHGLLRADLGWSLATHRPVLLMIGERLPWTLSLVGAAVLIAAAVGGVLGTAAAGRRDGQGWRLTEPLIIGVGALPEVLVAMALIVVFSGTLRVFPAGGATTPFLAVSGVTGWTTAAGDLLWHAALPAATLILGLVPAFFLLSRSALTAVLGEPFLLTVQGKGLGRGRLLWHAWRNALPPTLTLLGLRLAFVITGAAIVERLFAYPGLGMLLFEAVAQRDYAVMQGVFLIASIVVLTVNLALDLVAGVLDPRMGDRGG